MLKITGRALGEHYARTFSLSGVGNRQSKRVGHRPWGLAGFREPILADCGERPTSKTRGHTQHCEDSNVHVMQYEAQTKCVGANLRSLAWTYRHRFDTCGLTWRGSQAMVRVNACSTRLPVHAVHTSHGRELKGGWAGSRE